MNYPGGKGGVFHKIINLMPAHEVYIETHLGGGAILRNKRPAKRNIGIEIDPEVVEKWSDTRDQEDFELVPGDAVGYLKSYRFTGDELIYCDPPYLRETRKKKMRLYRYDYSREQHIELLEILKSVPCKVMVSGYESALYKESLNNWHTHCFQAGCHHGVATEWLWMNYKTPVELHDYRYLGDSFRERERIKRKSKRWVSKFQSMPVLERQALLWALQEVRE
jgi:DNA adenine methylase